MIYNFACVLVLVLFKFGASMNTPLWAVRFSSEFTAKISNFKTNGKYWYDANRNGEKI